MSERENALLFTKYIELFRAHKQQSFRLTGPSVAKTCVTHNIKLHYYYYGKHTYIHAVNSGMRSFHQNEARRR